ncbi:MAG TPA: Hsp20/alpha crystallin family protein [Rubrobacteraceae bacterium]|nr:Hsp20/alpha crystallin family protein [Rubrobacteraceae bacterium]
MQSEMDRLFGETFGRLPRMAAETEWAPAVDVTTEDGDMVIRAELPGVKREDVDVTLSGGVLTISGERKEEQERKDAGYLVRERRYGSFRRAMTLPEGTNESKVSASFEDGVLEVKVRDGASVVEERPRRIEIEE